VGIKTGAHGNPKELVSEQKQKTEKSSSGGLLTAAVTVGALEASAGRDLAITGQASRIIQVASVESRVRREVGFVDGLPLWTGTVVSAEVN
jgi:hypothetical protein